MPEYTHVPRCPCCLCLFVFRTVEKMTMLRRWFVITRGLTAFVRIVGKVLVRVKLLCNIFDLNHKDFIIRS